MGDGDKISRYNTGGAVLGGGVGAKFRNMGGAVLGGRDKISRSGRCQIGWWKAGTKTK